MDDLRLVDLIGPMLGADLRYAEGEALDRDSDRSHPVRHRFWVDRHHWRVERDDGVTFIDGPDGTATVTGGRVRESRAGHHHAPGLHLADQLLRPRYAPIWGRPGEDWRLSDDVQPCPDRPLARIRLDGTGGRYREHGHALVDPATGRLHELATPGFTWTLLNVRDVATADPAARFRLPAAAH